MGAIARVRHVLALRAWSPLCGFCMAVGGIGSSSGSLVSSVAGVFHLSDQG
jgi:hypothetical protein